MRIKFRMFFIAGCLAAAGICGVFIVRQINILNKIIERLSADSRVAQVIVTESRNDPVTGANWTTIKFLEYDVSGRPLAPRYFSFAGDIIHFQALVIRFDDVFVRGAHPLKGKSAYIFTKVFFLNGQTVQVYEINRIDDIPSGYRAGPRQGWFERMLWKKFWVYALNPRERMKSGVKNAQIEAPGTRFIPGIIYTIKIEHDGGLRIDTEPVPDIFRDKKGGVISRDL